jgi:signal transduction histidine kinase
MNRRQAVGYVALLSACWAVSIAAGWTQLGVQLDNDIFDFLFRISGPPQGEPQVTIAGIDEQSLNKMGGQPALRRILAEGLRRMAEAPPAVVAVDILLAGATDTPNDALLEEALARTKNLILATYMTREGWDDPLGSFARWAKQIGHVHSDPDRLDNVVRRVALEKASPGENGARRERRFALSLEALRLAKGVDIVESPEALEAGNLWIPGKRDDARSMVIWYRPIGSIPEVTFHELVNDPAAAEKLRGKVVFVGVTAQGFDRHMTPVSQGQTMAGVEINANAYDTLVRGRFLRNVSNGAVVGFCVLLCAAVGIIFARWAGWWAYLPAAALLGLTHVAPWAAFHQSLVFPYAAPLGTAWLCTAAAASFQYFFVRRQLRTSQAQRDQYQQAIHFVAHEMRSPLTAIQGSSELMGRYKLPDEKKAEIAKMINAESKRLARMIQTFLDVERLSAGQMELKREPFAAADVVAACVERVKPLAERKQIQVESEVFPEAGILGDKELLEYAVYNLMTNAVKYSPGGTQVKVWGEHSGDEFRISVRDQGIGMDEKELKRIFRKFYRTKKAEQSGENGTGIGLSIVEQIVIHHGGKMEVTSSPGAGSCFTMVLPASHRHDNGV